MPRCWTLIAIAAFAITGFAQDARPYRVLRTERVGGAGGFDYVYADEAGRRLYVTRRNPDHIAVFDLDTLAPVGEIGNASAAGVAVSTKSGHGFASSKPVVMWDLKTLATIKTIDVEGGPDAILHDPFNDRIYVFSHSAPNATVIDAASGSVLGTIDLGGAAEEAVTDRKGRVYVDVADKANVAVLDARTMRVANHYDLKGRGGVCYGLALDGKNQILFVAGRNPQTMVILRAQDGQIITSLPIGAGTDGMVFNPSTKEAFSSQADGTLTIVKEKSPKTFVVEQTLKTMPTAKTLTIDRRTGRIFLIGAEFGPPTEPTSPGGRSGRGAMVPDSFRILVVGR